MLMVIKVMMGLRVMMAETLIDIGIFECHCQTAISNDSVGPQVVI